LKENLQFRPRLQKELNRLFFPPCGEFEWGLALHAGPGIKSCRSFLEQGHLIEKKTKSTSFRIMYCKGRKPILLLTINTIEFKFHLVIVIGHEHGSYNIGEF
jgi:hypothetical protein